MAIEVEGDSVLVEFKLAFAEGFEFILLQVTHVDGRQNVVVHTVVQLGLELDGHDTVEVLVVKSKGSFAIVLVSNVIWIINDLPEIDSV